VLQANSDGFEASAQAKGFVGLKAKQSGSVGIGPVKVTGTVEEYVGVGGEASATAKFGRKGAELDAKLGVAVGPGMGFGEAHGREPFAMLHRGA